MRPRTQERVAIIVAIFVLVCGVAAMVWLTRHEGRHSIDIIKASEGKVLVCDEPTYPGNVAAGDPICETVIEFPKEYTE
jgi:hypothetical protein